MLDLSIIINYVTTRLKNVLLIYLTTLQKYFHLKEYWQSLTNIVFNCGRKMKINLISNEKMPKKCLKMCYAFHVLSSHEVLYNAQV